MSPLAPQKEGPGDKLVPSAEIALLCIQHCIILHMISSFKIVLESPHHMLQCASSCIPVMFPRGHAQQSVINAQQFVPAVPSGIVGPWSPKIWRAVLWILDTSPHIVPCL